MHTQLEHGQPVKGMTFADKLHLYLLPEVKDWWNSTPSLPAQMKKGMQSQGDRGAWQPLGNSCFDGISGNCLQGNLITTIPGGEENVVDVERSKHGPRAPVDIE